MMQQLSDLQFLKYFISDALYPRYDQENEVLKDFYSQHWGRFTELSVKADKILISIPLRLWFSPAYRSKTDKWDRHYHEILIFEFS